MDPNAPPTHKHASSIASGVLLVDKALRACGIDPGPLLRKAGINFNEAAQPGARLPSAQVYELHRLSTEITGDPCFGLKVASQMQPANLQGLGFAWLASDSLLDALERLVRFSRLINNVARLRLENTGQSTDLVSYDLDKLPDYPDSAIDTGMAVFLRMCRITAGDSIDPVRVDFMHSRPACGDEFEQIFRAPLRFETTDNRLCFDTASLEASLPSANPELARVNDQTVIDYLARFDRLNTAMQVRSRLIEHLPAGTPRQEAIAKALNLSLRSLQRKLKSEGTSFKALLENTRSELALQYVRETHRSLGEIAYLLGYSEPGNFTRAFTRWAGVPPQDFRDNAGK